MQQQFLEANGSCSRGITELLAQHNVEKRERTRDKLLSEIEESVAALVKLVGFPVNRAR